ncbi:MAG TPA: hypothetical protein VG894_08325 [Bauldia sp.]|nr:hypothetical protein [Bauldia sp.]
MGALADGYAEARKRHDDQVAELHRKETLVDAELHELGALIAQDGSFLKDNGLACEIGHRILRITHLRTPAITVHYNADSQSFSMTIMHDGTVKTLKATDECARAIGEALFDVVAATPVEAR